VVTEEKINAIVKIIISQHQPVRIILFGSCASNNYTQESDVDIVVVKETDKPRFKRGIEIRKSLLGMDVPIDLLVYTTAEYEDAINTRFSFLSMALKNSRILYEKQIAGIFS
jgi:predicted nucleotidyltransferase